MDFEGRVTRNLYDAYGRLSGRQFFDNLTQYNSGSGTPAETFAYTYDAFGRQTGVAQPGRTVTFAYDAQGRLTAESGPEGVIGYSYDNLGRRIQTAVYLAGDDPSVDVPQRTTSYTYDALGRLKSVVEDLDPLSTLDAQLSTQYFYDLLGNLDLTLLPNNVAEDYVYDSLNRLDVLTHYRTDGTTADLANLSDNDKLAEFDYEVRDDGKRTVLVETFYDADGDPVLTNTYAWDYDALGRLVEEDLDSTNNALDFTATYAHDLTGNRLEKTVDWGRDATIDETTSYAYDANDRLTTEALDTDGLAGAEQTTTYDYSHTQQTGKTVTQADSSAVETNYAYDLQGRMQTVTNVTRNTSSVVTRRERLTYDYDSRGIRTSSLHEIDADANNVYETRTKTEYLIDHRNHTGYQQVLRETHYDADTGLVTKTVDYTLGHDEIIQTTQLYDSSGNPTGSPVTLVFGHDGHGSVRVLTDMAAAVAQFFIYDAYGQLLAIANAAGALTSGGSGVLGDAAQALTSILHSGEQTDAATGLQNLRDRMYDPRTGRFMTKDSFVGRLTDPQSLHKYLYTHADPVNGIDPTGMFTVISTMSASSVGIALSQTNAELGSSLAQGFTQGDERADAFFATKEFIEKVQFWVMVGLIVVGGIGYALSNAQTLIKRTASALRTKGIRFRASLVSHSTNLRNFLGAVDNVHASPRNVTVDGAAVVDAPRANRVQLDDYLSGSGGRWGSQRTRHLNDSIATSYELQGFTIKGGAGRESEEGIPGPGGSTQGGTWVDITATDGTRTIRIQTVDTLADGVTPTLSEAAAAERIRAAFPGDELILVPKP